MPGSGRLGRCLCKQPSSGDYQRERVRIPDIAYLIRVSCKGVEPRPKLIIGGFNISPRNSDVDARDLNGEGRVEWHCTDEATSMPWLCV